MEPYRRSADAPKPRAAPETGVVADMVRQFADPFAFVRELVQNGIDAGATAIEIAVEELDGTCVSRVRDDGSGMTLDVIERALLVLFRSTKDEDPGKIGKYGVGFISVLGPGPEEVNVDTIAAGHGHRVRLFRDHRYEIEDTGPAAGHGTTVELVLRLDRAGVDRHVEGVRTAISKWCRHAKIPLFFRVARAGDPKPERIRMDAPLGVRAVVQVAREWPDMRIVLGPTAGAHLEPLVGAGLEDAADVDVVGFYNRGLLLHETRDAETLGLAGLRVKCESRHFQHTLSRDDIRREGEFRRALTRARDLAAEVTPRLGSEVKHAAAALASASDDAARGALRRYEGLLAAAAARGIDEMWFPIVHPIEGESAMMLRRAEEITEDSLATRDRVLISNAASPLTVALAEQGVPIVLDASPNVSEAITREMRRIDGEALLVTSVCWLVSELEPDEARANDPAFCNAIANAMELLGYAVDGVALGRSEHAPASVAAVWVPPRDRRKPRTSHVVAASEAPVDRAGRTRGRRLVLLASHPWIASARAGRPVPLAADLLVRALLVSGPGLTNTESLMLLEHTLRILS